jgi:hypothetical protein
VARVFKKYQGRQGSRGRDYALGQGIEKTVRNEVFKEIWSEIERARSRNLDPPLCDGTIILRRIGPTSHRDGTDLRQAKGLRRSKLERRATAFLPPDRIIASFGSTLSRGAKLSHGKTVSGKAKERPPQEGRHPRCRPRAVPTVQGLLRRAHILSAQHQTRVVNPKADRSAPSKLRSFSSTWSILRSQPSGYLQGSVGAAAVRSIRSTR